MLGRRFLRRSGGAGRDVEVRDADGHRTLYFVSSGGDRIIESRIDLAAPHRLILPYTRLMMAGLMYARARQCLLIGLGGGAMVHFLNRVFPAIQLDVVELQPSIIALATSAFGVRPAPGTRILQGDGALHVAHRQPRYDVIFVDGFLQPGTPDTDSNGTPNNLKGQAFAANLIASLGPVGGGGGGVVVFNLNEGPQTPLDIATLKSSFGHVRFLRHGGNVVAICLPPGATPPTPRQLTAQAKTLDRALPPDSTFTFHELAQKNWAA